MQGYMRGPSCREVERYFGIGKVARRGAVLGAGGIDAAVLHLDLGAASLQGVAKDIGWDHGSPTDHSPVILVFNPWPDLAKQCMPKRVK